MHVLAFASLVLHVRTTSSLLAATPYNYGFNRGRIIDSHCLRWLMHPHLSTSFSHKSFAGRSAAACMPHAIVLVQLSSAALLIPTTT
jgi:hypothetical protein